MRAESSVVLQNEDGLIPLDCAVQHADTWVDIGLTAPGGRFMPSLYRDLLRETESLLETGDTDLFFFMHKPPGLRWRFRVTDGIEVQDLSRKVVRAAEGLLGTDAVRATVYEPQQALFGGTESMRFVHQSWCLDSLLWLRWHAGHERMPLSARWDISFAVLAHVFTRLGVIGWEDREVWACISEDTGRRLADHEWTRPEVARLAESLRNRWKALWPPRMPQIGQGPDRSPLLDDFLTGSEPILTEWREDCLSRPVTRYPLGSRRAAAYWTVFHWNRAGFSGAQQALTAQTLAAGV